MADDRITVILEAIDQASEPLQGLAAHITDVASRGAGALGGVATALTGVGVIAGGAALAGVLALGKAGVDAWGEMDTAADTLMLKTGATGGALDAMAQSVMDLRASAGGLGVDTEVIAETMATLSQRTGTTGEVLEGLTGGILEFSAVMGGDAKANTEALTGVLAGFNVDAEDSAAALDVAFVAAQKFGVQGDELLASLDRFGPTLRGMGMGLEESASFLGGMTAAGLDADKAMAAITKSAASFAKEGLSVKEGLTQAITAIQGATSEAEAMSIAAETFGSKAAVQMVEGIRSGKISADSLTASLGETTGALHTASEAALDAPERWQQGMAQIQNALVPVGEAVMGLAAEIMPLVSEAITTVVVPALANLGGWLKDNLPGAIQTLKDVWASIQPALETVMGFITGTIFPVLATFTGWLQDNLPGAISALVTFWQGTLWPALQTVAGWLQANLFPILATLTDWFLTHLPGAINALVGVWQTYLQPALLALWSFIQDPLAPVIRALAEVQFAALKLAFTALVAVWDNFLYPALSTLWDLIQTYIVPVVQTFAEKVGGLQGVMETVSGFIRDVTDTLNGFRDALAGIELPSFLQRHSPSEIEQTFAGLAVVTPEATTTIDAFKVAVGGLDAATLNVESVNQLAAAMRLLVDVMSAPGMGVEPGSNDEERIRTMSDALGRIAAAVKATIDTLKSLVGLGAAGYEQYLNGAGRDWIVALYNAVAALGRDMAIAAGNARASISSGVLEDLRAVASVLQTTTGIIKSVVDAVQTVLAVGGSQIEAMLNDLAVRDWVTSLVYGLAYWGRDIAVAVSQVRAVIGEQAMPELRGVNDLLGTVGGVVASMVETVNLVLGEEARSVEAALNDLAVRDWVTSLVYGLTYWAARIAEAAGAVSVQINTQTTAALTQLGENLAAIGGTLARVFDIVRVISKAAEEQLVWDDTAIERAVLHLVGFGLSLSRAAQYAMTWRSDTGRFIDVVRVTVIPSLANLGENLANLGGVVSGVMSIARAFADAAEEQLVWSDEAIVAVMDRLVAFALSLSRAAQYAMTWRSATGRFIDVVRVTVIPSLANLGENLANLGSVIDGVFGIVRAFADLVEDKLIWDDAHLQASLAESVAGLVRFALALAAQARAALNLTELSEEAQAALVPAIPSLSRLGAILGDLGSVIDGVFGIVRAFADAVEDGLDYGPQAQAVVGAALLGLVQFAVFVADRVNSVLVLLRAQSVVLNPALEVISDSIGQVDDLLNGVFDVLQSFADAVEDGLDYGPQAQAVVGAALLGLVQFAVSIADRVNSVLFLLRAQTVVLNPALERIAGTLGDIVSLVRDTVSLTKMAADLEKLGEVDLGIVRARLLSVLPLVVEVARDFAHQASVVGISDAWQTAASAVAGVMGDAVGAIKDALDVGALLSDPATAIPSPAQVRDKMAAIMRLVEEAVNAFSAQALTAAAGGMDVEGLTKYAAAVKGVFEAIGEIASAINAYSGINVGPQYLGVESVGFGNISGALRQIWALFEDAVRHHDLVLSVVSTLTTALDGVTALAQAKGADAGNAWLLGFQAAISGGIGLASSPSGTGTGAGTQVVNNYVTNNTRTMTANVNATTSEAGKGAVMGAYTMVMY